MIVSSILIFSLGVSLSAVHQFTHNGPHEEHIIQTEFDHLRSIAHVSEREVISSPSSPSHGPEISIRSKRSPWDITEWNIRPGKGIVREPFILPRFIRSLRSKRGFMEEEFHWSNGKGRIVERNPQPGLLQQFGNGLDSLTKGMANKFGWGGQTKDSTPVPTGQGVGQVSENNPVGGFLSQLAEKFKLPAIPRMMLKDPMAYVPDSMKNAVTFLQQKWGEISAAAKAMISEVCRTRINCQAQSQNAINLRNTIKDKLRQFRMMFGVGNEKDLEAQFDRTQQVKKALLSRAGLGKEVEPADDGVFDSDTLLTTKQSEMLLNQLGQGGKSEVVPEAPTNGKKRAAIFFEDEFFQKWDMGTPIPYIFDSSIANWEKTDIRDALREISSKTCIQFGEQNYKPNGYHINYVKVASSTFCGLSYIGRTAPANPIYLSFACGEGRGVALHETLHALGVAHEHVRMDRDQHIKVDWSNIDPRYYDAFAVSDPKTFTTYGVKYDYGSIMHYRFNSAAINTQKATMIPLANESQNIKLLGQRKGLSERDVELLNKLYCKPDSCLDTNVYCGAWALQGVCTRPSNNVWMGQNCRKSCEECSQYEEERGSTSEFYHCSIDLFFILSILRSLCSLSILIFHLRSSLIPQGFLAVDVLIVLSGYFSSQSLSSSSSSFSFITHRFSRLLPLYSFTVFGTIHVGERILTSQEYSALQENSVWSLSYLSNVKPFLSSIHSNYFTELAHFHPLSHTWSLSLEIQFILLISFFPTLLTRRSISLPFIVLSLIFYLSFDREVHFGSLPARLWQFILGSLAKTENKKIATFVENIPWTISISLLFLFFIIPFDVDTARISVTILAVILIIQKGEVKSKIFSLIGDLSYSIYLIHWPIISFYQFRFLNSNEETISFNNILICISIIFTISSFVHPTIEKHFQSNSLRSSIMWTSILYFSLLLKSLPLQPSEVDDFDQIPQGYDNPVHSWSCAEKDREISFPRFKRLQANLYPHFEGPNHHYHDRGDGPFNIVIIGNSYAIYRFPWIFQSIDGQFSNLTVHMRHACMPTLRYRKNPSERGQFWKCHKYTTQVNEIVEEQKPDILIVLQKYHYEFLDRPEGGIPDEDYKRDHLTQDFQHQLNFFSKHSKIIIIDTPMFEVRHGEAYRLSKNIELGENIEGIKTNYTIQEVHSLHFHSYNRLSHVNCSSCQWINLKSALCHYNGSCPLLDTNCSLTLFKNDGSHLSSFGRHLVYPIYRDFIDRAMEILNEKNLK